MIQLLHKVFVQDFRLVVVALFCATVLWFWVDDKLSHERTFSIPLTEDVFELPEPLILQSTGEDEPAVQIIVKGPRGDMIALSQKDIVLRLNPGESEPDTNAPIPIPITERDFRLPPGLSIQDIKPRLITINVAQPFIKALRVRVITQGMPAAGYTITKVSTVPDRVNVQGRRDALEKIETIDTEPVKVEGMKKADLRQVVKVVDHVTIGGKKIPVSCSEAPTVTIRIDRQPVPREISGVPIKVLSHSGSMMHVEVDPKTARVIVEGLEDSVKDLSAKDVRVFADVSDRPAGTYQINLVVAMVPETEPAADGDRDKIKVTLVSPPGTVKAILTEPKKKPRTEVPAAPEKAHAVPLKTPRDAAAGDE